MDGTALIIYSGIAILIVAMVVALRKFLRGSGSPEGPSFSCCAASLPGRGVMCRSTGNYPTASKVVLSRPQSTEASVEDCALYCASSRKEALYAVHNSDDKSCSCVEGCSSYGSGEGEVRIGEACLSTSTNDTTVLRNSTTFRQSCGDPFTVRSGDRVTADMCDNELPDYSAFKCGPPSLEQCCNVDNPIKHTGTQLSHESYIGPCGSPPSPASRGKPFHDELG